MKGKSLKQVACNDRPYHHLFPSTTDSTSQDTRPGTNSTGFKFHRKGVASASWNRGEIKGKMLIFSPKMNMSWKKGPFQKSISSFKYWFSGDMLVFGIGISFLNSGSFGKMQILGIRMSCYDCLQQKPDPHNFWVLDGYRITWVAQLQSVSHLGPPKVGRRIIDKKEKCLADLCFDCISCSAGVYKINALGLPSAAFSHSQFFFFKKKS